MRVAAGVLNKPSDLNAGFSTSHFEAILKSSKDFAQNDASLRAGPGSSNKFTVVK